MQDPASKKLSAPPPSKACLKKSARMYFLHRAALISIDTVHLQRKETLHNTSNIPALLYTAKHAFHIALDLLILAQFWQAVHHKDNRVQYAGHLHQESCSFCTQKAQDVLPAWRHIKLFTNFFDISTLYILLLCKRYP